MLQLRLNLASTAEAPKSARLAPCQFGEQIVIQFSWAKQFIVNLKALYQLGRATKVESGEKNPLKFGWNLTKSVLATIDSHEGDYKKAIENNAIAKLAWSYGLLLERV